ncbi:glycoside hydrolase family 95 protein [Lutibacter citreus]|uniref:glycoside hydrolase family 95 protein n=1 Tax=Lutibacter citreus TaxID=2138210 RepID=UPI000DBE0D10|nr:glycoside hydrolase family 95 protein [Lutibacter citreus]
MKIKVVKKTIIILLLICTTNISFSQNLKLWYDAPAEEWTGGLPIGNGRLMGMVQGKINHEIIQLNEESVWTGAPTPRDKPNGAKYLSEIRQLMFDGKYFEAEQLTKEKLLGLRLGFGMHTYQTLGDLELIFDKSKVSDEVTDYRRELNLEEGIVKVSYIKNGVKYTREIFSSFVDQSIIVKLTSSKPGALSLETKLTRKGSEIKRISNDHLALRGVAFPAVRSGWSGVEFESHLQVSSQNGKISQSKQGIRIDNADSVTLRLVADTDYRGEKPFEACVKKIEKIKNKSFQKLRESHVADYKSLFDRVELNFKETENSLLPTDKRLLAFKNGEKDPNLVALYFQYGRYLLMSSSRPGSMAINLWGKWVSGLEPAYNADYHININIQMNYWLAEMTNLGECQEPFIDMVDNLRPRGRVTAKTTYGARGFVAHHATDAWWFTAAVGNPPYGMWPMAPAWSCQHLWEHYLFGKDKEYLKNKSYPIMKEASEFFLDYLVEHPKTGYMVSGPSTSPENRFITPNGKTVSLSMAPTMDNQLMYDLFSNTIEASKVLNIDTDFRSQLEKLRARITPMKIGSDGRLLEWSEEFKEQNKGHRHISHLWGLCPGNQITQNKTPKLFEAARKSLDVRVENGSAISPEYQGIAAWVTCSYARLLDGEKTYKHLSDILSKSSWDNLFAVGERGRARKMFETDVNFGVTSAIAEMLVQSHAGFIHILPALPKDLPSGNVKGLRARGGFEVDINWSNSKVEEIVIKSLNGEICKLMYNGKQIEFKTKKGKTYKFNSKLK